MKKLFTLFVAVLFTSITFAQAPEKMSYQAVIRDAGNVLVSNQAVGMQISVLQGSASGTAAYIETQTPTTNANGLVSIEIGMGAVVSGDFSAIDWSAGPYFVKTETDPTGGNSYTITGTSQLMSVPYALYAKTSSATVVAIMTDSQTRTINPTNNWLVGPIFSEVSGFKKGSKIKLIYSVPSRKDGFGWGGLYIEPQISFDSGNTWNSLGSCGYDGGIMANNSAFIGTYTNTILIDPLQSSDFSVIVRLYYKAYPSYPITVNGNHDINNISGVAPLMPGDNGLQHFTKVIIEEIF